ncbi:hypothetical protein EC9_11780 [Rosistilla ulvae]|uniref:Uncharacterized protein n=1 Tax=Rosistilla ulvae TaxID=1930277 RepID=A0A517LWL5_9BACT|nr:hypothetical protein [Rosistilla ulvae]QDS87003.1 hypothetical protein EC9_11780 [Rosistilla ulvae]
MHTTPTMPPAARRGGIRKLFLCGCLLPMLLLGIGVAGAAGYGWYFLSGKVVEYTETEPRIVPTVAYTDEEANEIGQRANEFFQRIQTGNADEQFVLSTRELNVLLNSQPGLKDRVFVTLQNGRLHADLSIPTDRVPGGSGRFLNASGKLELALDDTTVSLSLIEAEVKGEPIDESLLTQLRDLKLSTEEIKDPRFAALVGMFQKVTILDDRLVVQPRPGFNGLDGGTVANVKFSEPPAAASATPKPPKKPSQPEIQLPGFGKVKYNEFAK